MGHPITLCITDVKLVIHSCFVCQIAESPAEAMYRFHIPAHFDQAAYYSDVGSAGMSFA